MTSDERDDMTQGLGWPDRRWWLVTLFVFSVFFPSLSFRQLRRGARARVLVPGTVMRAGRP
jgi:hypothetical protein